MTTPAFNRSFMFTSQVKRHGSRSQMTFRSFQSVRNGDRCLLRIKRAVLTIARPLPVYRQLQTSHFAALTVTMCQQATSRVHPLDSFLSEDLAFTRKGQ